MERRRRPQVVKAVHLRPQVVMVMIQAINLWIKNMENGGSSQEGG